MADAVYWPSSLSRSIKRKKERGQYLAILAEQVWSIKNLLYGKKENTGNPKQARWAHHAHSVANQNAGFASPCPLTDSTM